MNMAERTIDLRKKSFAGDAAPRVREAPETINWSALEHEARERGPYWFLGPGAIALALIIFGIFAHSYFFIAFIALAFTVLLMYAHRPPREITLQIGGDGVYAGKTHYQFSELKSFWIFEKPEEKELSLETAKLLSPYLRIPLGSADPQQVKDMLARFLPEQEHKEFISDQIAKSLGF